jgi:hypothetical protein
MTLCLVAAIAAQLVRVIRAIVLVAEVLAARTQHEYENDDKFIHKTPIEPTFTSALYDQELCSPGRSTSCSHQTYEPL